MRKVSVFLIGDGTVYPWIGICRGDDSRIYNHVTKPSLRRLARVCNRKTGVRCIYWNGWFWREED